MVWTHSVPVGTSWVQTIPRFSKITPRRMSEENIHSWSKHLKQKLRCTDILFLNVYLGLLYKDRAERPHAILKKVCLSTVYFGWAGKKGCFYCILRGNHFDSGPAITRNFIRDLHVQHIYCTNNIPPNDNKNLMHVWLGVTGRASSWI